MSEAPQLVRHAVRALLLTPRDELLLLRIRHPVRRSCFWIAPGGGVEPGETVEAGLRRELREELGLTELAIGPLVWRRQHTFDWGGTRIRQSEQYHVIHVPRFEPRMSDAAEARSLEELRWWPASALAGASEPLTPLTLPTIVSGYLTHGAPVGELDVEVLED